MKIQLTDDSIGKRFLTREGEEVVCTEKDSNSSNFPYCFSDGKWRTIDGDFNIIGDHQYDIISEIKQENNMEEIIENILHRLGKYTNTTRQEINDRRTILTEELSKLNPNRIDGERIQKEWHIIYPNDSWENSWMKKIIEKYNSTATEPLPQKELPKEEWWENADSFMYANNKYPLRGYEVLFDGSVTLYGDNTFKFPLSQCSPYTEPTMRDKFKALGATDEMIEKLLKEVKNG